MSFQNKSVNKCRLRKCDLSNQIASSTGLLAKGGGEMLKLSVLKVDNWEGQHKGTTAIRVTNMKITLILMTVGSS